jgi:hypothetical protein
VLAPSGVGAGEGAGALVAGAGGTGDGGTACPVGGTTPCASLMTLTASVISAARYSFLDIVLVPVSVPAISYPHSIIDSMRVEFLVFSIGVIGFFLLTSW